MEGYEVEQISLDACPGAVAVTSMARGSDGNVYAGLTGRGHVLARIDVADGSVEDLGEIFPCRPGMAPLLDKIHNSLLAGPDGELYIGQGLNLDWNAGPRTFDLAAFGGGHLFRYDIATGRLEDLGLQVPLNAIHGMTMDARRRIIYGYTIPDNHFFVHYLDGHRVEDKGRISNYASHNLACGADGTVYGGYFGDLSWTGVPVDDPEAARRHHFAGTYLYRYHPDEGRLARTSELVVYGDEVDIFSNKGIDSLTCSSSGELYGGTAVGGTVFRIDGATGRVAVVGKPVLTPRISGMQEGPDGSMYMTAGFPLMHLVRYDPRAGSFTDFGEVRSCADLCYFHGMAVLDDGTVYVGETDSARLAVYKLTPKGARS